MRSSNLAQRLTAIAKFAVLIGLVTALTTYAAGAQATAPSPVSTQYPPEPQHCLHPPIDHGQVYWSFGGSTVMTTKYARLTPAVPGRKGWLWNEYPLESEDFEVEFKFEVFSKPHLGGDGFALWFVNAESDPSFLQNTNALTGPIFGMKSNFKGVGVLFDVYDNDHQRNNPAIFVIQNNDGNFPHSHDLDFEHDMVKKTPPSSSPEYDRYRCVVEYRNLGRPVTALVKFLNRVLRVYIDTGDGQGWRFCLAVEINRMTTGSKPRNTLRDTHIAFTAATGQVSDNIDILEVTTRYLKSSDKARDTDFAQLSATGSGRSYEQLVWFLITAIGICLTAITVYDFNDYKNMMNSRIDVVTICHRLNENVYLHAYAHAFLTFLLLVQRSWLLFILNLLLCLVRFAQHRQGALELNSASLTRMGTRLSGVAGMSPDARYIFALVVYVLSDLYYIYRLFSDV